MGRGKGRHPFLSDYRSARFATSQLLPMASRGQGLLVFLFPFFSFKGFSSNKAPGYDKVSARILKDSLPVILPSITSIMNYSFHTGTFAKAWKIAEVTPILKSSNSEDP